MFSLSKNSPFAWKCSFIDSVPCRPQPKAKFEPYWRISDGELKLYISADVLITVPEGRPIFITGINHFDTTSLYRENMTVIWSMIKKSEEKKKVAVVTLPYCSGLKLLCDFFVFPSGLWDCVRFPLCPFESWAAENAQTSHGGALLSSSGPL